MTNKIYSSAYECIYDLGAVMGVSNLKDMDVAIKFAKDNGFPQVAEYFESLVKKLEWHIRKEFEVVGDS